MRMDWHATRLSRFDRASLWRQVQRPHAFNVRYVATTQLGYLSGTCTRVRLQPWHPSASRVVRALCVRDGACGPEDCNALMLIEPFGSVLFTPWDLNDSGRKRIDAD